MPSSSAGRTLLLTVYPPEGGAARHVIELASGLDPDSWEIDVACLRDSEPWRRAPALPNVTLHPLGGRHGRPAMRDVGDLPLLVRLSRRADVIHAHSAKAGFLTRCAAVLAGRPRRTIFTPHGWSYWAATGAGGALVPRSRAHRGSLVSSRRGRLGGGRRRRACRGNRARVPVPCDPQRCRPRALRRSSQAGGRPNRLRGKARTAEASGPGREGLG